MDFFFWESTHNHALSTSKESAPETFTTVVPKAVQREKVSCAVQPSKDANALPEPTVDVQSGQDISIFVRITGISIS